MRSWATVAAAVVATATLVTALLAPGRDVPDPVVTVAGNTTVACPVGDPVFGQTTVVGAADSLTWSTLGGEASQPGPSVRVTDPAGAVVVTGDQSMGVLSLAVQQNKPVGLLCAMPSASGWWDGVWVNDQEKSAVVVTNLDETTATVTITVLGDTGTLPVPALRQIPVKRFETRTVDLATFLAGANVTVTHPVAIELRADTGRVMAYLNSQGSLGQDWRQSSVAPSTDLVIPGVPATSDEGTGSNRYLFVTNHGDNIARVQVLGQGSGPAVPLAAANEGGDSGQTGASGLVVQAHTTTLVDVSQALSGETIGVVVHALPFADGDQPQPVTAALVVVGNDMGSVAAQPPLAGGLRLPVVKDSSLVATNPGPNAATLTLTSRDETGQVTGSNQVEVPVGTQAIPLTAETGATDVEVRGEGVRAVLVVPAVQGAPGLVVAPLGAGGASGLKVRLRYDPTLG